MDLLLLMMKRGTLLKVITVIILLIVFSIIGVLFYNLFNVIINRNASYYTRLSNTITVLIIVIGAEFGLMLYIRRLVNKLLSETVGKVFKVEKVVRLHTGFCRYEGLNFMVTCPDDLTVGDYVKVTGYSTVPVYPSRMAYPNRIRIFPAKKLQESDPEYPHEEWSDTFS